MREAILQDFDGFHNTIHEHHLDSLDEQGSDGGYVTDLIENRWHDLINDYANAYVDSLSKLSGVPMRFHAVESPKYYNYSNDRVVVKDFPSTVSMLAVINLKDSIKGCYDFKIRDGYTPHYSDQLEEWGDPDDWDHNQLGWLLQDYIQHGLDKNDVDYEEAAIYLMEDYYPNI